jgi:hypothetical protein
MASITRSRARPSISRRSLADHVVEAAGPWRERPECRQAQLLRLSDPDDEVILAGPLDVNLSLYADHELRSPKGQTTVAHQPIMSHDIFIPAGSTWHWGMGRVSGIGGNLGSSAWIRPSRPTLEPPLLAAADLPCDYAVRAIADTGEFFPSPCDPCEGGPIRVPPGDCGPAVDVLPARGGCVRPRYFNGMFITREDLEAEQRYMRLKLRMHNRAAGTGVVWGLDVALRGEHVVVGPGYGVDCCGNDLAVTCDYSVHAATLLRDPAVCGSDRRCYALLLEYVECPEDPRPVHGDGCEPQRAGCELSRIRETTRLRLVPPIATPQTPLARFLEQVEDLRPGAEPEPATIPVAGTGTVPAPESVAVPFTFLTTLGTTVELQPHRTQVVTGSLGPITAPSGLISFRVRPHSVDDGLTGMVRRDDGTAVAALSATGAAWTAPFGQAAPLTYVVDWSTTGPQALRGQTTIRLDQKLGDIIDGVVRDTTQDKLYTAWPEDHGLNPGDEVFVGLPDGDHVSTTVEEVQDTTVVLKRPPNFQVAPGDRVFYRLPSRLGIAIRPTEILMEQVPPEIPCCGAGCCDDHRRLAPTERLQALLAALLYGRIVQRNTMLATEARGPATLAALRALLGVPARRLPEFEQAVAALYRAWCTAALYPGPQRCDPDGVVIGCARVQAGALCEIDPLDGRRWVVHQPLLDHWAGAFGLDPLDRRIGDLFRRLCCLSHLPGFGQLVDRGLPDDAAEPSPSLTHFVAGPMAAALPTPVLAAAPTATLDALARVTELDTTGIATVVEELLCGRARVSGSALREPARLRAFVAEAFADLPAREQPRRTIREVARDVARVTLAAVPVRAAVGKDNPLTQVLAGIDVRALDHLLAIPREVVAELAVAVAAPEQIDEGIGRAEGLGRRVAAVVAESLRAVDYPQITRPEQLRDEAVVRRLTEEIGKRLEADDIELDREALAKALLERKE